MDQPFNQSLLMSFQDVGVDGFLSYMSVVALNKFLHFYDPFLSFLLPSISSDLSRMLLAICINSVAMSFLCYFLQVPPRAKQV